MRCLNNTLFTASTINAPSIEKMVPLPEPLPSPNIIDRITDSITEYIDKNGVTPTHIHIHPSLFKEMMKSVHAHNSGYFKPIHAAKLHSILSYQHGNGTVKISFVDIHEDSDFLLIGNQSAYNDFVMERDLLGDHH